VGPASVAGNSDGKEQAMSYVTAPQPTGTPTWVDLGIPDLERAMGFYGALFGWQFAVGPEESGRYTMCLLRDKPVAALMPNPDQSATDFWWNMYFATDDCDGTLKRVADAGGTVIAPAMDVMDQGRMALVRDTVGAQFGLWQAGEHLGCEIVNEPGALVRNDLVTAEAAAAREFYPAVFDYTLDRNEDLPDFDFTFLRLPGGHEIGGIFGRPDAPVSRWATTFEVADTDAVVARAVAGGGKADTPQDMGYGRLAAITDPFGTEFSVITRPAS
jgi:predicted enzyme related to lactoylglutathione lyase